MRARRPPKDVQQAKYTDTKEGYEHPALSIRLFGLENMSGGNDGTGMKLHLIAGARPNFMKIAPLWQGLRAHADIKAAFIHMAQHRDAEMTSTIWRDLGMADPDHIVQWQCSTSQDRIAPMMAGYEKLCLQNRPDAVLVVGDVSASLAAAMTASKLQMPLIHLEAGLRCFDLSVPEERNRMTIDRLADLHLTPSADADENLLAEGITPDRIRRVGNIMIDTCVMMNDAICKDVTTETLGLAGGGYVLVTLHRPGNVDDRAKLRRICHALGDIASHVPVCWPLHPRTRHQLEQIDGIAMLEQSGVKVLAPLGYVSFGAVMANAGLVVTDSGGVQEETSWRAIPCLTLRPSTERPVTIDLGTNRLVSIERLSAMAIDAMTGQSAPERRDCEIPLWDGQTTGRVIAELDRFRRNGGIRK